MKKLDSEWHKILKSNQNGTTSSSSEEADQAEPEYDCAECDNLRWISPALDVEHPSFGRAYPCKCQEVVWGASLASSLETYSRIDTFHKFEGDTLPNGPASVDGTLYRAAFEASINFAKEPNGWLVLQGKAGLGKTHLAVAIASKCIENGLLVRYENCLDLINASGISMSTDDLEDSKQRLRQAREVPVLILDGLYVPHSPRDAQLLGAILSERRAHKRPTVVTTELEEFPADTVFEYLANRDLVAAYPLRARGVSKFKYRGFSERMLDLNTLAKFDTRYKHNLSKKRRNFLIGAREAAETFVSKPQGWLYIAGPTQIGKTHLALGICQELAEKDYRITACRADILRNELYNRISPGNRSLSSFIDELQNEDILLLDDFGGGYITEWTLQGLYQIIIHRYDNKLPTIFTSPGLIRPVQNILYQTTLESIFSRVAPNQPYAGDGGEDKSGEESKVDNADGSLLSFKMSFSNYLAIDARLKSDFVKSIVWEYDV